MRRKSPGTTGHGVPTMPGPRHHLPGSSVLVGNLLFPSRDQVVERDTGDAGSEMRAGEKIAGLGWLPRGSQLPGLVAGVWVSQGGEGLPGCRRKARWPHQGPSYGEAALPGVPRAGQERVRLRADSLENSASSLGPSSDSFSLRKSPGEANRPACAPPPPPLCGEAGPSPGWGWGGSGPHL